MAKKRRKVTRKKKSSGAGWRRSPITAGIAVIIILVCVYNTFGPSSESGGFKGDYVCTTCRDVFREAYIREKQPYPCFECEAKTLWTALKCGDCDEVSAALPALTDYSCSQCDHKAEAKISGDLPHACPKCSAKSFWETFYCNECDVSFSAVDMDIMCPDCQGTDTVPSLEQIQTCEHCDSENLGSLTPYAVIRWELGKTLTPEQEQQVEEWRSKQD